MKFEKLLNTVEENIKEITNNKTLEKIIEVVENQMEINFDLKENFMYHDKIDNYIYVIKYSDEHLFYDYIGKRTYEKYLLDKDAIEIQRWSKDVYPTKELLLSKLPQ